MGTEALGAVSGLPVVEGGFADAKFAADLARLLTALPPVEGSHDQGFGGLRFLPDSESRARLYFRVLEAQEALHISVTDRVHFAPYRAGIAMLWAMHSLHADRLEWNDAVLARLTATPRVMEMIREGHPPQDLFDAWEDEVAAFGELSRKYWLYE